MFACKGKILPPEIIEEILPRLPPKSLGRFKSVSKTWRSLISDPKFIKNHINNKQCYQTTTKLILVPSYGDSLYSLDLNEIVPYLHYNSKDDDIDIFATATKLTLGSVPIQWEEVLGSCNGLILAKDIKGPMYLINPTTTRQEQEQELFEVPPFPFEHPNRAFSSCCGFGYDSLTDDYKVIWIAYFKSEKHSDSLDTCLSVYSLRNNSWKKLPNPPYGFNALCGALVNRNYHWPASSATKILVLSLADESYSEIKLPDLFQNQDIEFSHLVNIGGKLGLFMGVTGDVCHLWVMEECGISKSWAKVFSYNFTIPLEPVCLVEGSSRDIVMGDTDEVVVFNIDEKRFRKVRMVGDPYEFSVGGTFVESIESHKRIILAP